MKFCAPNNGRSARFESPSKCKGRSCVFCFLFYAYPWLRIQNSSVSFLGKVSVVDRILVSLSHVRRVQSSPHNEVPNFLERRSASPLVFLVTFRNSHIDVNRACGEYSFGKLAFILNFEWSSRVPTYEFLFYFLGRKCLYRIVQTNRREALEGM